MLRKAIRWLNVIVISLLGGILLNVGVYLWARENPYKAFEVSERLHIYDLLVDDLIWHPVVTSDRIIKLADDIVVGNDLDFLLDSLRNLWTYKEDFLFWDVPTHPIVVLGMLTGDCDDYARLAAYIAHRKGQDSYYVMLARRRGRIGHAVCVYVDTDTATINLVDVNGKLSMKFLRSSEGADYDINGTEVAEIIRRAYRDYSYVSVRSWDAKEVLYMINMGGN